jgi:hypothetical protein
VASGDVIPWSYVATRVATGSVTADSGTWNGSESSSLLTVSPTLVSGLVYGITLTTAISSDAAASPTVPATFEISALRVREDTAAGNQLIGAQVGIPTTTTVGFALAAYCEYTAVASGAKSFVLTGQRVSGTGNHRIRAGSSRPTFLTVTLIPA